MLVGAAPADGKSAGGIPVRANYTDGADNAMPLPANKYKMLTTICFIFAGIGIYNQ